MKQITFITGNESKAKQVKEFLKIPISHQKVELDELQGLELEKIVEHKAKQAFNILNSSVLVEDVSLTFKALNQLPGPLIKWFLESIGNEGLCRLLDGYEDRSAIARVVFGYCEGREVKFFDAECEGSILKSPKGGDGFGFDYIFVPKGQDKTWAEIDVIKHPECSMRIPALQKLEEYLSQEIN